MTRLFVYGSLLKGFSNHRLLASSAFVREARTVPVFTMIDLGGYPAIMLGGKTAIEGELYDIGYATVDACDRLEGHPNFYARVTTLLEGGEESNVYVLRRERAARGAAIESGSWREFTKRRAS